MICLVWTGCYEGYSQEICVCFIFLYENLRQVHQLVYRQWCPACLLGWNDDAQHGSYHPFQSIDMCRRFICEHVMVGGQRHQRHHSVLIMCFGQAVQLRSSEIHRVHRGYKCCTFNFQHTSQPTCFFIPSEGPKCRLASLLLISILLSVAWRWFQASRKPMR